MKATVTQCAVLVGGLGTRLGALTATTPKPILPCGGRPFLFWLLREFVRFGVTDFLLLTGHLSAEIERAAADIQAALPRPARITLSEEPIRAGTGGAVFHARDQLQDRFLLCNGDSLFDCNFANLLAAAATDRPDVIGRIVLRQLDDASRYGVVEIDRTASPLPGTSAAGHQRDDQRRDLSVQPVAARASAAGLLAGSRRHARSCTRRRLRGTLGDGYFRDIGVPDDFARAQTEIPALLRRKALFLDRDGVLNVDHGYVGSRDRFEWIDGALDAIRYATQAGWHVFIVTNQSGVARGHYDEAAVHDLLDWIGDQARPPAARSTTRATAPTTRTPRSKHIGRCIPGENRCPACCST